MEAIKEIYKCPLCSHGTLTPETHSCHRQFVKGLQIKKDNIPKLLEWEEYKKKYKEARFCIVCSEEIIYQGKSFCSRKCYLRYVRRVDN